MRVNNRAPEQLRDIRLTRGFMKHAEGSVLVEYGSTQVLCNASVISGVPKFLKGSQQGWITAEYGMLPRSTHERMQRETKSGPSGRTQEIQRLIGRSLRTMVDLSSLGENTIIVDCDVLQADGGTRTASITGACVAVADALKQLSEKATMMLVASVSVGIYQGVPIIDLDYEEDSNAETDMNVVMNEAGDFIEIQGTAEKHPFTDENLTKMLTLAKAGIAQLIRQQKAVLGLTL